MSNENKNPRGEMKPGEGPARSSHLVFWLVSLVGILLIFMVFSGQTASKKKDHDYEGILTAILEGKVRKVTLYERALEPAEVRIDYREKNKPPDRFKIPPGNYAQRLYDTVQAARSMEEATGKDARSWTTFVTDSPPFSFRDILPYLPALILFLVIFFALSRLFRAPGASGSVLSFGKSRARLVSQEKSKVTFSDVAGIDEALDEVREIIEFLKNPGKFQRLGGRVPRGVVLVGPPGTGKTLLAKAIAGEANVPFFSISGSDFVEMFVGVGASRVRDLFKQARDNSPCIVFLDEVDAVGRKRGSGLGGGHDEREQTLNSILVEMDGFDSDEGIIVIAATNRPDVLDPALLRPGRFDREIVINLPDLKGREEILKVHTAKVKLAPNVDLKRIARGTPTFSGAELAALVNEAAIQAAMKDQEYVTTEDLEEARDKIRWGRQKKSMVMLEEERRLTAYHEAGHALVAHLLPEVEPLHKVTIIPRGMSLGATMQLPEHDRYHLQRRRILGDVCVLYGGRAAEELFCEDVTTGARDDIRRATELLRLVVCEFGMSENLGPISYMETEEHLFLGREIARTRNHSEKVSEEIDETVRRLARECYGRTQELLKRNRRAMEKVVEALLKREVLSGDEVAGIVAEAEREDGEESKEVSGADGGGGEKEGRSS